MDPREHAGAGDTGHDGDVGGVERGRLYESARVEAFSDNVMAVAITLLVLDLSFRRAPARCWPTCSGSGRRTWHRSVSSGLSPWSARFHSDAELRLGQDRSPIILDNHGVADADLAVAEDVGPQAAAMEKVLNDPGPRQTLQVRARLAQLHAHALDVSDPEPPADQVVQAHAAHHNLAARLGSGKPDVRQCLGLDQRQRHAPRVLTEVPVAHQALARERGDRVDRRDRVTRADVDLLDVHPLHHRGRWRTAQVISRRPSGRPRFTAVPPGTRCRHRAVDADPAGRPRPGGAGPDAAPARLPTADALRRLRLTPPIPPSQGRRA